jgi:hypothetical protein
MFAQAESALQNTPHLSQTQSTGAEPASAAGDLPIGSLICQLVIQQMAEPSGMQSLKVRCLNPNVQLDLG